MSSPSKPSEIHSDAPDPLEKFHPGLPDAPSQEYMVSGSLPVDRSLADEEWKTYLQVSSGGKSEQTTQYTLTSHQETRSRWGNSTVSSVMPRSGSSGLDGSLPEQALDPAGAQSHTGSTRPESSASGTSRALNSCKFVGVLRCTNNRTEGSEWCAEHQAVVTCKKEELPPCKQCPAGTAITPLTSLDFQLCMECEVARYDQHQCVKCGKVDHQNVPRLNLGLCGSCRPVVGKSTTETQSSSSLSPHQ